MMSPRCSKPMTRYEAANGPMPEEPTCGRPAGHPGPCRSEAAVARMQRADVTRITQGRREGRYPWWSSARGAA